MYADSSSGKKIRRKELRKRLGVGLGAVGAAGAAGAGAGLGGKALYDKVTKD
jgi:hypothetical protein